jgi:hypothetical protein
MVEEDIFEIGARRQLCAVLVDWGATKIYGPS